MNVQSLLSPRSVLPDVCVFVVLVEELLAVGQRWQEVFSPWGPPEWQALLLGRSPDCAEFPPFHSARSERRLREGREWSSATQLVGGRPGLPDSKAQCFPCRHTFLVGTDHCGYHTRPALGRHLQSVGCQISYFKGLQVSPKSEMKSLLVAVFRT